MKHQIVLLGGQVLPVYIGIKEFNPDVIHIIASPESSNKINLIKNSIPGKLFHQYICDAFDFNLIKTEIIKIVDQYSDQQIQINLTSGTKVMVLAASSIINDTKVVGFYVNQNMTYIEFPGSTSKNLNVTLTIKEVIGLSGNNILSYKKLSDFSEKEYSNAELISDYVIKQNSLYLKMTSAFRSKFRSFDDIPPIGQLNLDSQTSIIWTDRQAKVISNSKEILKIEGANTSRLLFNAMWWELLVTKILSAWKKSTEIIIQCELPFKNNSTFKKNEIDILINLGGRLLFVECKSGMVRPEDINKMKAVKDVYGGIISNSLLVSRYKPDSRISEKCAELNIDIFYCFKNQKEINSLDKIHEVLDRIKLKSTI